MSKKAIKPSDKVLDAVRQHVENRFAAYGVQGYKFEFMETPRFTYDFLLFQNLEPKALGIFRHALTKCELGLRFWTITKEENEVGQRWLVQAQLHYEHIGGGSNGCDTSLEFYINDESRIAEIYK